MTIWRNENDVFYILHDNENHQKYKNSSANKNAFPLKKKGHILIES